MPQLGDTATPQPGGFNGSCKTSQ